MCNYEYSLCTTSWRLMRRANNNNICAITMAIYNIQEAPIRQVALLTPLLVGCVRQIMVLDEATASVDTRTQQLVQQTIRECCSEKTVLTIAHQLNTIWDSDAVVVMDRGKVGGNGRRGYASGYVLTLSMPLLAMFLTCALLFTCAESIPSDDRG